MATNKAAAELDVLGAVYKATPYFLPVRATLGVAGSQQPDAALLAELHLPFPRVAILFGADLDIPSALVTGDEAVVLDRMRWDRDQRRAGATKLSGYLAPPGHLHPALLSLARCKPVRLAGVILAAGADGIGLDDVALWLTVVETAEGTVRRVDPGLLSCATLRPLVANFAAAVAWGDWHPPPDPLDLPDTHRHPSSRRAVRRGHFRRCESGGSAAMVRVLDARPRIVTGRTATGTHASPVTHNRREFTRRQRVGPRDNWRYETRYILPTLVNPGMEGSRPVMVYRLPDPA